VTETHVCEQLAQGCYLKVVPIISQSLVRRSTATKSVISNVDKPMQALKVYGYTVSR